MPIMTLSITRYIQIGIYFPMLTKLTTTTCPYNLLPTNCLNFFFVQALSKLIWNRGVKRHKTANTNLMSINHISKTNDSEIISTGLLQLQNDFQSRHMWIKGCLFF